MHLFFFFLILPWHWRFLLWRMQNTHNTLNRTATVTDFSWMQLGVNEHLIINRKISIFIFTQKKTIEKEKPKCIWYSLEEFLFVPLWIEKCFFFFLIQSWAANKAKMLWVDSTVAQDLLPEVLNKSLKTQESFYWLVSHDTLSLLTGSLTRPCLGQLVNWK